MKCLVVNKNAAGITVLTGDEDTTYAQFCSYKLWSDGKNKEPLEYFNMPRWVVRRINWEVPIGFEVTLAHRLREGEDDSGWRVTMGGESYEVLDGHMLNHLTHAEKFEVGNTIKIWLTPHGCRRAKLDPMEGISHDVYTANKKQS